MAHRQGLRGVSAEQFKDAPQLRQFFLRDVRPTGKQLGEGSYGEVVELEMAGLVCAGKKMYNVLIDPRNQGTQNMVDRYHQECTLLSELRHPHIVQFLGICFLTDSRLPVLVMERLNTSFDNLLEETPDVPLHVKLAILHDVAKGLVFLHNRDPVIVHRDLTARNVLLNASMTAKIADLGNSRITDLQPGQLAQTMTRGIPGTLVYMPPEASEGYYGPPLDMFSFGHMSLFAATQVFPKDLLAATYYPDGWKGQVKARTELERRSRYIAATEEKLGKKHPLVTFIKECLANPMDRPTASQAIDRTTSMMVEHRTPFGDMIRFQLERRLDEKTAEADEKTRENATLTRRLRELNLQLEESTGRNQELELQARAAVKQREEFQAVADLQAVEIAKLRKNSDTKQTEPAEGLPDFVKCKLPLKWKSRNDLLYINQLLPQTVMMGEKVYVGGGGTEDDEIDEELVAELLKVYEYSMTSEGPQWKTIISPCMGFAMAVVDNKLIIAGGWDTETKCISDKVSVLDSENDKWVQPFLAMPTARGVPSAIGYKRWLVVIGGEIDVETCTNVVEVLDTSSKQWYKASPLPGPTFRSSLSLINDTFYMAWKNDVTNEYLFSQISIPTLISTAISGAPDTTKGSTKWQTLPETLTVVPSLTSFRGHLLAVGDWDEPSSTIAMYLPHKQQWVEVAELPTPRDGCTSCFLPSTNELLVFGGMDENKDLILPIDIAELDTN